MWSQLVVGPRLKLKRSSYGSEAYTCRWVLPTCWSLTAPFLNWSEVHWKGKTLPKQFGHQQKIYRQCSHKISPRIEQSTFDAPQFSRIPSSSYFSCKAVATTTLQMRDLDYHSSTKFEAWQLQHVLPQKNSQIRYMDHVGNVVIRRLATEPDSATIWKCRQQFGTLIWAPEDEDYQRAAMNKPIRLPQLFPVLVYIAHI